MPSEKSLALANLRKKSTYAWMVSMSILLKVANFFVNFDIKSAFLHSGNDLPFDWSEYRIYKEMMQRRRSTGSHLIVRGLHTRLRIKRFR